MAYSEEVTISHHARTTACAAAVAVLVASIGLAEAKPEAGPADPMQALVQAALATLSADPLVHDALLGRSLSSGPAYFPQPAEPRYVVVPIVLLPRADETDLTSLGITGFHELQFRVDRLHLRISDEPTAKQASAWLQTMNSSFTIALPLARATFATLPQASDWKKRGIGHSLRAILTCYSGRNDVWSITFVPMVKPEEEVTIQIEPSTKRVLSLH